jgi:predicted AlkP superfamily pyrophosphatase or phosphodiesterase
MKHSFIAVWLIVAGLSASTAFSQTPPPGQPAPRLVLVLSIDQMRFDYLTRFDALYKGGLRTLLDRGAIFTNARYRHAATETGPGHSVILTGRHPSHSGIVANDWYDAYLGKSVNVVEDPVQRPLGGAGRSASPAHALGFTVGDVLKANSPESKVVAVSLKDRSAILLGGRRADGAYWYETAGGNFITSTYYMPEAPSWLAAWNERRLADQYAGKTWERLLPDAALYERYAGKDAVEGEWDRKDTVFPHAIRGAPPAASYYDYLRRTPFSDDLTLDVALEAMQAHRIGEDGFTDILAIGFAASDVIGHTYGPDSHETLDQLLRLDVLLERLFAEVDARVGLANTLVVLTSDHGAAPLVETLQAKGLDAQRAPPAALQNAVRQAFDKRFPGIDALVEQYSSPDFYLNEDVIRERKLSRAEVEQTAITALLGTGLVATVYTHDDLRSTPASSEADPFLTLFKNGFYEPRSPHLTVLLKEHVYLSSAVGGTGHGTAYERDRHVPVVFMGPRIEPGFYSESSGPEDIAPTLALILGLPMQREHDSRLLTEMLPGN